MKTNLQQNYQFVQGFQSQHVKIGFGSYGQIKLAKSNHTHQLVAIKLIYSKNAHQQINVHSKLHHPNIIQLLDSYRDNQKGLTYMVLQYADGGSLFERIKMGNLSKKLIRKIFYQVCCAVLWLHHNNVMHRDIKPQNILLTKDGEAKLCDFGLAALIGQRKTLCGTYEYMAPQMIRDMVYDYKVDVWALGILFFQMIQGVAPFRGQSADEVLKEMKKSIYFSDKFDQEQISLIKSILRVNPDNRPTVQTILQHSFFKKYNKEFVLQDPARLKFIKKIQQHSDNQNSEKNSPLKKYSKQSSLHEQHLSNRSTIQNEQVIKIQRHSSDSKPKQQINRRDQNNSNEESDGGSISQIKSNYLLKKNQQIPSINHSSPDYTTKNIINQNYNNNTNISSGLRFDPKFYKFQQNYKANINNVSSNTSNQTVTFDKNIIQTQKTNNLTNLSQFNNKITNSSHYISPINNYHIKYSNHSNRTPNFISQNLPSATSFTNNQGNDHGFINLNSHNINNSINSNPNNNNFMETANGWKKV